MRTILKTGQGVCLSSELDANDMNILELSAVHPCASHQFGLLLVFLVKFTCVIASQAQDQPSIRPELARDEHAKVERVNQKLQQVGRQLQRLDKMLDREQKTLSKIEEEKDKAGDDQIKTDDEKVMRHSMKLIEIILVRSRLSDLKNNLQNKFDKLKSLESLQLQINEHASKLNDRKKLIKETEDQMAMIWSRLMEAEWQARLLEEIVRILKMQKENIDKGVSSDAGIEKLVELTIKDAKNARALANSLRLQRKELANNLYKCQDELLDLTVELKLLRENMKSIEESKSDWNQEIIDEDFDALINNLEEIELG